MVRRGVVVVCNGAPRAGKSSLAAALRRVSPGRWHLLGNDIWAGSVTPKELLPGLGLRPGGERPDLEPVVRQLQDALFGSIAAHARAGLDVVADLTLHDAHATPARPWRRLASALTGLDALVVGVRCAPAVLADRMRASDPPYRAVVESTAQVPDVVRRWDRAVHDPGHYNLEVDTSTATPAACAALVAAALDAGPPWTALSTHLH